MARRSAARSTCCAGQDIYDARAVADRLGIAHYVFDYESRFRDSVIERFADEYARGRTPIPCISCNQSVKFTDLFGLARDLGADCLATGHYVRRVVGAERRRAAPRRRSGARPELFPVRDDPRRSSISCASRSATCPSRRCASSPASSSWPSPTSPTARTSASSPTAIMRAVVEKVRPEAARPGEIVDRDGRVLGAHRGLIHFTVGQRRGLEIGGQAEPLYVLRLEPESGRVVVGPKRALAVRAARLERHQLARRGPARRPDASRCARWPGRRRRGSSGRADGAVFDAARIWRRARPGGGALRGRAGARRRLDRGDRARPSSSRPDGAASAVEQQARPRRRPPSIAQDRPGRLRRRPQADREPPATRSVAHACRRPAAPAFGSAAMLIE